MPSTNVAIVLRVLHSVMLCLQLIYWYFIPCVTKYMHVRIWAPLINLLPNMNSTLIRDHAPPPCILRHQVCCRRNAYYQTKGQSISQVLLYRIHMPCVGAYLVLPTTVEAFLLVNIFLGCHHRQTVESLVFLIIPVRLRTCMY